MIKDFITKLQSLFGATKSELFSVIFIFGIILSGLAIRYFSGDYNSNISNQKIRADIYHKLDSLAEANRTTFTGTDFYGEPVPELAKGDTIVAKEKFYQKSEAAKDRKGKSENLTRKINLNTASKVELMKLPGVGEKTALKIIEYRSDSRFLSIEDIKNVKGIGDAKFEKLKDFIEVK